jgi:hypothetical protein
VSGTFKVSAGIEITVHLRHDHHRAILQQLQDLREQITRIEQHIKGKGIYTAFDFGKVQSALAEYEVWAQANTGVVDAALKTANS